MSKADGMRIITLTDEPPVRIKEDDWATVAQGDIGDVGSLRVRQHVTDDRKIIVYGTLDLEDGTAKAGRMLDRPERLLVFASLPRPWRFAPSF